MYCKTQDNFSVVADNLLCLCLHHVEDDLVPLPHALGVRGADVILNDDLPLPPTEPAPHEALHLWGYG